MKSEMRLWTKANQYHRETKQHYLVPVQLNRLSEKHHPTQMVQVFDT